MFDINKLGDLSKIAGEARHMQEKQERQQREQMDILKKISGQLDQIISILNAKK